LSGIFPTRRRAGRGRLFFGLSELGVKAQPAMNFFHCRNKCVAIAALPSNVCQGEQPLPHAL
jgi:hypothetical protein